MGLIYSQQPNRRLEARNTVLYRYRTSIFWQDLPARFGDFCAVHTRYSR